MKSEGPPVYHCSIQGKTRAVFVFDSKNVYILSLVATGWQVINGVTRDLVGVFGTRALAIQAMRELEHG